MVSKDTWLLIDECWALIARSRALVAESRALIEEVDRALARRAARTLGAA